jgi:hypothetical protein
MQLRTARLCLDCEEIHNAQVCPVCASETFAFLSRWVPPPPTARPRSHPAASEEADAYRRLIGEPAAAPPGRGRMLKKGLIGLTAVGLFGWAWRTTQTPGVKNRTRDK